MSTTCGHSSTYVDCSRAAANAGFLSRTVGVAGDHLTKQPEEQGQSFKDWFEMGATQQRNGIISRRNKLYVVRPPSMTRPSEEMRDWNKPVLPPDSPPGTERWNSTLKMFKQLIVYLRAFCNTMQITQYPKKISFLPIEQRKRVHFVDTPRTQVIGLKTRNRREPFEIRYRPSPQLDVSDLRDALTRSIPPTAHSFVMVVDHDMYEDGEGAYVTGRAYGLAGINPLHRWPASRCKAYVDESGIRQAGEIPPYICPVCYSKLGWELVLLQHGFEGGIEREKAWLESQYAALKAFCNKWNKIPQFAAFVARLEKRLEDRKGDNDNDDATWPSN
ncbi:hypothetical protein FOC4_g10012066 [Fusarium odoratissimum]|uniref:Archaemetzincin-2 n=1 Tax=Fusarium oxysporum f. sp. cubense (strain race 4) TaxID=2502994 RepID=N1R7K1_FUSC4|nr:hypothetical protein FOC4_g10012066 [Fusarium odoratissimum]